jgi:hypothetical protein
VDLKLAQRPRELGERRGRLIAIARVGRRVAEVARVEVRGAHAVAGAVPRSRGVPQRRVVGLLAVRALELAGGAREVAGGERALALGERRRGARLVGRRGPRVREERTEDERSRE